MSAPNPCHTWSHAIEFPIGPPNLDVLIAARVIQGAGSAAGTVVGRAMVQDRFQGPQRTKVMAYIGMAMGLSPPLAAIVGGQLHVRLGWQANFILVMALALLMLVAAWRGLPGPARARPVEGHWLAGMLSAYATLLREKFFQRTHLLQRQRIAFDGGGRMHVARSGVLLQRRNPRQINRRALDALTQRRHPLNFVEQRGADDEMRDISHLRRLIKRQV